jgi:predicted adenylyl cyclase CyaB
MARNLELKARIRSVDRAEAAATACGAAFAEILRQVDTYFNVPRGRLKLRIIEGEGAELIFYERGEDREERWSIYENIPIPEPAKFRAVLEGALGVKVVVRKTRVLYKYHQCRIHIDTVERLGSFVEFEVPDSGVVESEALMKVLREVFEIAPGDIVQASYSDLILG